MSQSRDECSPKEFVLHKMHLRKVICNIGDRRYNPDTKTLEMRSELNVKVSQNGLQDNSTLNMGFLPQKRYRHILRHDYSRNQFIGQGHNDPKWQATYHHSKMHPYTKFGIPNVNEIGDTLLTRLF